MPIQWFLGFCLLLPLAFAALEPLSPGSGDVFRSRSTCTISWDTDFTKTWKNVTIYLMSGSNLNMSLVTPIVEHLDGTDPRLTPFHWRCPDVTPNAAIYFYQFTNNEDWTESAWTTRFTIASPSGSTTPPQNSKQPGGDPIPWGVGHLVPSRSIVPSKPWVSPHSHLLAARSCETLNQDQCTTPLENASTSDSDHDIFPRLRQRTRSFGPSPIYVTTQETRTISRGTRGRGPALGVQFLCGLATLLLLVI
ncbi:hypothetical protein K503DRAFT_721793 [Rhizopogon vinicolor AM-OR11-026]|uniref:Yeast cell wall synthesis Kre9/Knh1-like N-terminal domain-containing protein n=1 Tax=Rhizopogon vinicolor AM-OR11-026 TaxID=1314800 RepID=A0A1B7MU95_9AGAM|nr:hypothetical protein K503DRAFT_721793 [Rhizopogon vinicolor AM-OR11-026]